MPTPRLTARIRRAEGITSDQQGPGLNWIPDPHRGNEERQPLTAIGLPHCAGLRPKLVRVKMPPAIERTKEVWASYSIPRVDYQTKRPAYRLGADLGEMVDAEFKNCSLRRGNPGHISAAKIKKRHSGYVNIKAPICSAAREKWQANTGGVWAHRAERSWWRARPPSINSFSQSKERVLERHGKLPTL